ncbi:MAG: aminodeoxychorismate synthase, component I [Candidatus Liberibacter europaeus]|uniref:Aminodeoxychorismate synthase, component I n=1 Tax=Candidatus Liberibacter europaeus TaxID=744859 RepID=A0A2T4VXA6_9HYPH|nr:aminodeoxychorismate synthase component I [Candidatus Liberibacter europaeus]PTL86405.1 MAG: aminodeoxychorismate synthase, component I [Candidatus Liberibacter europaeus]
MKNYPSFVLFRDDWKSEQLLFTDPVDIICARNEQEFHLAFSRIENARLQGKWLAGYISYEAGFLFDKSLRHLIQAEQDVPLLCFGVFKAPTSPNHVLSRPYQSQKIFLHNPKISWNFKTYQKKFEKFYQNLCSGNCYQGNLTFPIIAQWYGDPLKAFWSLIERQPVRYGSLISLQGPIILSRSPELFFDINNKGYIETRPMKGTMSRGKNILEDQKIVSAFKKDCKNLSENRMIVDLLRNDLSRISITGTVKTPSLFEIEQYTTIHQMVSSVCGQLVHTLQIKDIFAALFPCGSITGVPKIKSMQILQKIEKKPRGIYCGAIGFISPTSIMRFSVAIRTISLFPNNKAVFNVGGAITYDSNAESEYEECLLKSKFAI